MVKRKQPDEPSTFTEEEVAKMNKQTEDKILEMLLHVHEKSTGAHPLDPQKDGVEWWIKRCGGTRSLRTQIRYMGIDAHFAEEFWLKYGHDDLLPRTFFLLLFLPQAHSTSYVSSSPL